MRLLFHTHVIIVFFLLFLLVAQVKSQTIHVKYLGSENGLSNNAINAIFQDHKGFIWFGTYDGLNRYDGYGFKVFRNVIGDSTSISSNSINAIDEDTQHNLWVCNQKELNIYNPVTASFSTPFYVFCNGTTKRTLKDNVIAVKATNANTMLAGTQHNGLFYFTNTSAGRQIPLLVNGKAIVDYYVSAIDYDKVRKIAYVFVEGHGLFVYNSQKKSLTLKSAALANANCLEVSKTGRLWLGNNSGLYYYDEKTNRISQSVMPVNMPIVNLHENVKGTLWIASDGGGVWLLPQGKTVASALQPVSESGVPLINSNAVYAIYEDKNERTWIGTLRGGINIIEPKSNGFKKISYQPADNSNPVDNFILSFCEDINGGVWIGTDGAGLRYWNRSNNTYQLFSHDNDNPASISSNFVTNIIQDTHKNIWLATWFGGINRYNRQTKTFKRYSCINTRTTIDNSNVWCLLQDSRNRLWASAVRNGGLYRYNPKTDKFEDFDNTLSELQSIAEDKSGNIWGGDYSSLILIDTLYKQHRFYTIGNTVRCIYEDSKSNFWIGTQEGGLLLFNKNNGTYKRFTTTNGLPSNTILRILEDKKGNLWLSTYNGLSKFDPQGSRFINFSQLDGLQSNEFSFNGALTLRTGEFLFGGIKGFTVFHPENINFEKRLPETFLAGIKINNTPIETLPAFVADRSLDEIKKIVVPYAQATLTLDFLALDFSHADDIKYAYYLKGWDKQWNGASNIRTATYSRLYEGTYTFEVKASNTEGIWSPPRQLLYITVLPPWYRTWWAYGFYLLLLGTAIYLYTVYKSRQTKLRYQIKLANLETQKERELTEKKIAFFTNISHEFRTPLSLIINPIKDLLQKEEVSKEKAELKIVYRNARRLLRMADQLLLFKKAESELDKLNFSTVNLRDLCKEVFLCFSEQARSKNINYELQSDVQDLTVAVDREKLEIALFNIFSNAFKYTPEGGSIVCKLQEEKTQVLISISDSGPGIPASESDKVFKRFAQVNNAQSKAGFGIGLYLVKQFVEAHGGTVYFRSDEGRGTTFFIAINKAAVGKKTEPNVAKPNSHTLANDVYQTTENASVAETKADVPPVSHILTEISTEVMEEEPLIEAPYISDQLTTDKQTLLIIDDDDELRNYLISIFSNDYKIYQAMDGSEGIRLAKECLPDLILSDIFMRNVDGIDLCQTLKQDESLSHIPIILLTGSSSDELQLKSMNSGADDFIKKPFDKDILAARVKALLKRRSILQHYFFNEVTLGSAKFKVSTEYKDFIERCMKIIEDHLQDDTFSIKVLASEIGMSHSTLYKKIKAVSGQSVNGFIRFIRLKKAAELLINTEMNVNETANMVGFYNTKYFRAQFHKLFGLNPSDYIKKFRKSFHNTQVLEDKLRK